MTAPTTLYFGAESSHMRAEDANGLEHQHALAQGYASLARQWMRHTPPTPLDMEHAIEVTEDAVMPLAAKLVRSELLQMRGAGAALILEGVGAAPTAALQWSLDDVEDLFNRLAMVSQGRPAGQEALPTSPEFYAAMVIVRECLHHLRFGGVVVHV